RPGEAEHRPSRGRRRLPRARQHTTRTEEGKREAQSGDGRRAWRVPPPAGLPFPGLVVRRFLRRSNHAQRRRSVNRVLDSSAVVKRYVQESGTGWIQGLAHPRAGNLTYLACITAVEVCAAIARRRRAGTIPSPDAAVALARFRFDLAREYFVLEITA